MMTLEPYSATFLNTKQCDVKAMITTYPAHVDVSRADKFSLIDLLAGKRTPHTVKTRVEQAILENTR